MNVRRVLRQSGIRPDKALGQNFLTDPTILQRIAQAGGLTADDIVLEIGAGTGALTQLLARDAGYVVAVELDQRLIPLLEDVLSDSDNVALIQGDILQLNPATLIEGVSQKLLSQPQVGRACPELALSLPKGPTRDLPAEPAQVEPSLPPESGEVRDYLNTLEAHYKVVANLPYYITSAILRHLLEADRVPELMVLTVQYEVAKRLVAMPGDMSVLAVSVQFYGDPEILFSIKPGSFYPSPDVESAVVRLDVHRRPPLPREEIDAFFQVVRAGFSQRRKQLHNSLSAGLAERISKYEAAAKLEEAGIDPRRRAQTLSVEEWIRLTHTLGDTLSA